MVSARMVVKERLEKADSLKGGAREGRGWAGEAAAAW